MPADGADRKVSSAGESRQPGAITAIKRVADCLHQCIGRRVVGRDCIVQALQSTPRQLRRVVSPCGICSRGKDRVKIRGSLKVAALLSKQAGLQERIRRAGWIWSQLRVGCNRRTDTARQGEYLRLVIQSARGRVEVTTRDILGGLGSLD